jgi:uncharacterized protein YwqG
MDQTFPSELLPYREAIEATSLPMTRLVATPGPTQPWESKFGGTPYFPLESEVVSFYVPHPRRVNRSPWPKDENGKEFCLLAQLNFEEIKLPSPFPTSGLLQFFIDTREWNDLDEVRLVYHPCVEKDPARLWQDFGTLPSWPWKEHALRCESGVDFISVSDFRFNAAYSATLPSGKRLADVLSLEHYKAYSRLRRPDIYTTRNRVGGYHDSQNHQDPRGIRPGWEESVLLLELDGCDVYSWGDVGSAQFFIHTEALKRCDFSDVLGHWDST